MRIHFHFCTQQPVAGLQRHDCNGDISQRIAKEGTHQRRQHVPTHQLCHQNCDQKMHRIKRSKRCKHAGPNATRNPLWTVRKAAQAVTHIMKRTCPTATRPKKFDRRTHICLRIAASKNHQHCPLRVIPMAQNWHQVGLCFYTAQLQRLPLEHLVHP